MSQGGYYHDWRDIPSMMGLQSLREKLDRPVRINSGYKSMNLKTIPEHPVFKNISDERLLFELLRRNQMHYWSPPPFREAKGLQCCIEIGDGNSADITLSNDDLTKLIEKVQQEEE